MLWSTLFHKIRKQPAKYMHNNHVFALLANHKTQKVEKVYLIL